MKHRMHHWTQIEQTVDGRLGRCPNCPHAYHFEAWEATSQAMKYYQPSSGGCRYNLTLVERVADWEWSSFHRYVRMGYYEADWGGEVGEAVKGMRCGKCRDISTGSGFGPDPISWQSGCLLGL